MTQICTRLNTLLIAKYVYFAFRIDSLCRLLIQTFASAARRYSVNMSVFICNAKNGLSGVRMVLCVMKEPFNNLVLYKYLLCKVKIVLELDNILIHYFHTHRLRLSPNLSISLFSTMYLFPEKMLCVFFVIS